jgi:hypothetical protein
MAVPNPILIKRASTPGKIPVVGDLQLSELAINTYDGKLYTRKNNGADSVIQIGIDTVSGDVTGTGAGNGNIVTTIAANAVTLAKMAQIATGSFLGRTTATTGNVEVLSAATAKALLALNNVDNTSDANKPISTAEQIALNLKENLSNKATDFSVVNNTLYPTVAAAKAYADSLVAGLIDDRGSYDASVGTYPTTGGSGTAGAVLKGDLWYISVGGTIAGVIYNVGDSIRALSDAPGQTVGSWAALESNLGYVPYNATNPNGYTANSTDAQLRDRATHTGVQPAASITESATQVFVSPAEKTAITHTNRAALDAVSGTNTGDETAATIRTKLGVTTLSGSNTGDQTLGSLGAEGTSNKDASSGYVGLTSYKINMKNTANTFTSFLQNSNTAARTYTYPDKDGTVAMISDITGVNSGTNTGDETVTTIRTKLGITVLSGSNTGDQTLASLGAEGSANKDASNGYAGLTLFKINMKNTAGSFTSFMLNAATAARNWTFPDKDGTVAMTSDITGTNSNTNTGDETAATIRTKLGITTLSGSNTGDQTLASLGAEGTANKDATGGYAGLTLFKINMKNALNTFTSFMQNSNTAARTYTFPDKDGTIATIADVTGTNSGTNTGDETLATIKSKLGITTLSGSNTGDQTLGSLGAEGSANKDATGGYAGLTLFKLNMKNVAGTLTSFFTNSNTAARTYTLPDKDGTVAMLSDIAAGGEQAVNKDASGGYVGLTLFKINFKNTLNTFTSFLTNSNTAARTYLFPDKDGTIAINEDVMQNGQTIDGGTF